MPQKFMRRAIFYPYAKFAEGMRSERSSGAKALLKKPIELPLVEHNYLEPDAGAGFVDDDGTLVVYASTQNPHYDHKELVSLLALEDDQVRVIQAVTGGGFGSKLDLNVQGFIGLALYHLKRPVRYVYSSRRVLSCHGEAPSAADQNENRLR